MAVAAAVGAVALAGLGLESEAASAATTLRVSVSSTGAQANGRSVIDAISPDGRFVVFDSWASNLVPGDTNGARDVFVRDRLLRRTVRVSVGPRGRQANGPSRGIAVSSDGRLVLVVSLATNLTNQPDRNHNVDVFVRNRRRGRTTRVGVRPGGGQFHDRPPYGGLVAAGISDDGRWVAFGEYHTPPAAECPDFDERAYIRDRVSHTTRPIGAGLCPGLPAALSPNGRWLIITQEDYGFILHDRAGVSTTRVGSFGANFGGLTPDAHYVAYGVMNESGARDLLRWNRITGRRLVVYRGHYPQTIGCEPVGISADGGYVACTSYDSNVVPGDTNGEAIDLFGIDVKTKTITRLDLTSTGRQIWRGIVEVPFRPYPCSAFKCGGQPPKAVLSGDGRWVAFNSIGPKVVPNDTNHAADVFLRGPLR